MEWICRICFFIPALVLSLTPPTVANIPPTPGAFIPLALHFTFSGRHSTYFYKYITLSRGTPPIRISLPCAGIPPTFMIHLCGIPPLAILRRHSTYGCEYSTDLRGIPPTSRVGTPPRWQIFHLPTGHSTHLSFRHATYCGKYFTYSWGTPPTCKSCTRVGGPPIFSISPFAHIGITSTHRAFHIVYPHMDNHIPLVCTPNPPTHCGSPPA